MFMKRYEYILSKCDFVYNTCKSFVDFEYDNPLDMFDDKWMHLPQLYKELYHKNDLINQLHKYLNYISDHKYAIVYDKSICGYWCIKLERDKITHIIGISNLSFKPVSGSAFTGLYAMINIYEVNNNEVAWVFSSGTKYSLNRKNKSYLNPYTKDLYNK